MANSVTRCLVINLLKINPKSKFASTKNSQIFNTTINNCRKLNTSTERKYISPAPDADYHDVKTFQQFLDDHPLGPKVVSTLTKITSLSKKVASEVIKNFKVFEKLSNNDLRKNYDILLKAGLSKDLIKEYPYTLASTPDDLKIKIMLFTQLNLDLITGVKLFQIPTRRFCRYLIATKNDKQLIPEFNNRIEYLASRLGGDIQEICDTISKYSYFLGTKMEKVIEITDVLLDAGMDKELIRTHLVLYTLDRDKTLKRTAIVKKYNVTPFTPWLVICPDNKFNSFVRRFRERIVLQKPYERINNYVMTLFNCSPLDIESLYKRDPLLNVTNKKNLTESFTLLHELGYTFEEIYLTCRSLHCSVISIRQKYNLCIEKGLGRPNLTVIASSNTLFQEWLKRKLNKETVES